MKVVKFGAVTGRTEGNIVDTDLDLYVNYSFGTFLFKRQVLIDVREDGSDNFATAGDSGSIVIDTEHESGRRHDFCCIGQVRCGVPVGRCAQAACGEGSGRQFQLGDLNEPARKRKLS